MIEGLKVLFIESQILLRGCVCKETAKYMNVPVLMNLKSALAIQK